MTDADYIAWLKTTIGTGIRVVLVEAIARIGVTETPMYLSNIEYTDAVAGRSYTPCISGGVTFTESLNFSGDPSISSGDIEIGNEAGVRDVWLTYVWANRGAQVYMGDPRWPRSDFRKVFDGVGADLDVGSDETLNLHLLDKLARLNNPMTETLLGGTTNNKDRAIPSTYGECFNVSPLLSNPATLEYQVHGGPVQDIVEVRDNGAPVSITKTIATGKFTLNQSPAGTITASVQGDKPAGVYSNNISTLVQNIVQNTGPTYTRFTGADLDATSLAAFAAAHTQPVGLYASDRMNVLDACQQLAGSVGAQVVVTSLGLLRLVQVALPATGTPTAVSDDDFEYHSLSVSERPPVIASNKLGYCKNWTVQDGALAFGLDPTSAVLFKTEWPFTTTQSDATVASVYKIDVQPPQQDSLLLVAADGVSESVRRRDLWKTQRMVYTAKYLAHLLLVELGDAITITHPRFGLGAGVTGVVVSIARDWLNGRVTIGVLA